MRRALKIDHNSWLPEGESQATKEMVKMAASLIFLALSVSPLWADTKPNKQKISPKPTLVETHSLPINLKKKRGGVHIVILVSDHHKYISFGHQCTKYVYISIIRIWTIDLTFFTPFKSGTYRPLTYRLKNDATTSLYYRF